MVSPHPPSVSQIRSEYTPKPTFHAQTHIPRPTGAQCAQDRLQVFHPEEVAVLFWSQIWGVSPGRFSLQNRSFTIAPGPVGAPGRGWRRKKGKKQSQQGRVLSLPVMKLPSHFHHFAFQHNEMWENKQAREGGETLPSLSFVSQTRDTKVALGYESKRDSFSKFQTTS